MTTSLSRLRGCASCAESDGHGNPGGAACVACAWELEGKARELASAFSGGLVYLSGPMTGLPELNRPTFDALASLLRDAGATVYNPAALRLHNSAGWEDYMRECLAALVACRFVIMLPGWEGSRGARLERQVAEALRMPVKEWEAPMAEGARNEA